LEINATDNKLYAGTYGRGLWRTDLYDSTLNVSDLSFEEFSLYPNPARDVINIRWNGNENPSVRIYNSLGKLVYYAKNVNLRNTFQVETSNFSEGLYFVKLSSSLGEITKKVVIE
jgi:hypothetical protein